MRSFLFLSALATATAATMRELGDQMWADWAAGDISNFPKYYEADAKAYLDPEFGPGFKHVGDMQFTEDVGIIEICSQFSDAITFTSVEKEAYEKDANNVIWDATLVGVNKADGINRRYHSIVSIRANSKSGLIEYVSWDLYRVERLDANAVGNTLYSAWVNGDFGVIMRLFHKDIELSGSGNRIEAWNGKITGFGEFVKFLGEHKDDYADDLSQFKYSVGANSPDGKSASANLEIVRTYKSGAKYRVKAYQMWTVDSAGQIVTLTGTVQSETALNARATWEDVIWHFGRGDLPGLFSTYGPNFNIAYGGALKNLDLWPSMGWKRGEVLDRAAFIEIMPKQFIENKLLKVDFHFISQSDTTMIVRYDMVYEFKGKTVNYIADYSFDFDENFLFNNCYANILSITEVEAPKEL